MKLSAIVFLLFFSFLSYPGVGRFSFEFLHSIGIPQLHGAFSFYYFFPLTTSRPADYTPTYPLSSASTGSPIGHPCWCGSFLFNHIMSEFLYDREQLISLPMFIPTSDIYTQRNVVI